MRVRLRRITKEYSGKVYVSYTLTLPKDVVEILSLSDVEEVELDIRTVDGELALVITKPKKGGVS